MSTKRAEFGDVTKCRGFGYFDDQATGDLGAVTQQRQQQPQPLSIASRQPGNVETEPDLGIAGQFLDRFFENIAVDQADQALFLDDRDELGTGDDASRLVAHPQQAFEIIDPSGCRAHHGLESKEQTILAERGLDRGPDGRATLLLR